MQHKNAEFFTKIENFIDTYVDENGVSPTIRDIAAGIGLNRTSVCKYLAEMERMGRVVYGEHRKILTRQMQRDLSGLTRTTVHPANHIAVLGSIHCGEPTESGDTFLEAVKLPTAIFGGGPLFILRASGDSMIEAGIDDGDMVVIKQQPVAERGDIVVALIEDGTTLKGFFPEPENKRIRLQPANSEMEPMYYRDVTIQGIAVSVIKKVGKMVML